MNDSIIVYIAVTLLSGVVGAFIGTYFGDENIRQKSLRSVAKRWVQEVLVNSTISEDRQIVTYPKDWFNPNAQIDKMKIADLLRDIDCGLWDNCLYWDYTNYRSVVSAMSLNATVEGMIRNSQSIQQNTNNFDA